MPSQHHPDNGSEKETETGRYIAPSRTAVPQREVLRGVEDDLVHEDGPEDAGEQENLFGRDAHDWDEEGREVQARLLRTASAREDSEISSSDSARESQVPPAAPHSPKDSTQELTTSDFMEDAVADAEASGAPDADTNSAKSLSEDPGDSRNGDAPGQPRRVRKRRRRSSVPEDERSEESKRRWKSHAKKRKDSLPGYAYVIFVVILCGSVFLARVAWQGDSTLFESSSTVDNSAGKATPGPDGTVDIPMPSGANVIPWEREALESLASSAKHAAVGGVAGAEDDLDRAESSLTAARLQSQPVDPGFFGAAIAALDRVAQARPTDAKLFGRVTTARVAVATLRSAQEIPSGALGTKPISFATSHPLAAGDTLSTQELGGQYIDATVMAEAVEVLMPPTTRSLADRVNVTGLTIAGATQTLDGVHWHKMEFVDTRVRYADGDVDLQDVKFVRCSFILPDDERGAQLADSIALNKPSYTVGAGASDQQQQTPAPAPK